jgi:hypothetical protein
MSAALALLRSNILANTLTAQEQGALALALAQIGPLFPEPDELANSISIAEEPLARTWMAALYSIQAGAGPMPPIVIEPSYTNGLVFPDDIAGPVNAIVAAVEYTPQASNVVRISFTIQCDVSEADAAVVSAGTVLTAPGGVTVAGGDTTGTVGGIHVRTGSPVTTAGQTGGINAMSSAFTTTAAETITLSGFALVQVPTGQKSAISIRLSTSAASLANIFMSMAVQEIVAQTVP